MNGASLQSSVGTGLEGLPHYWKCYHYYRHPSQLAKTAYSSLSARVSPEPWDIVCDDLPLPLALVYMIDKMRESIDMNGTQIDSQRDL